MKRAITLVSVLILAGSLAEAGETRSVAAVNAPLAYMAQVLGGPDVRVVYPVPAGVDPAFWQPEPEAVQLYQGADLILLNGAGYAGWVATEVLPRARLVDTTASMRERLIPAEAEVVTHKHGPEGEHAHDGIYAFTTWLDPEVATAQVEAAASAIAARWPDQATEVVDRADRLKAEVAEMGAAFDGFANGISGRQVFGSHPVYQYFDRAYLGELISLHWEPDSVPSEAQWERFEAQIRPESAPIMLWEDVPLPETTERLNGLGVEVVVLSPMANASGSEALFRDLGRQLR